MLDVLEAKINQLTALFVEKLRQNRELQIAHDKLKVENDDLKTENATLNQENAQLAARLLSLEHSAQRGSEQLSSLHEEKSLAKIVVDDLIKSIDALVERETQ